MWDLHNTLGFAVTELPNAEWAMRSAIPTPAEQGADTLLLKYEGRWDTALRQAPSLAAFPADGTPTGYDGPGTWRIATAVPEQLWGPFWRVNVTAKGQLAAKAPMVRWMTGATSFSAQNVDIPVRGVVQRANSRNPEVGVEISQLVFGSKPTLDAPGAMVVPPEPRPTTPTNIWTSVGPDTAVYHYPHGWVLDAVDAERITETLWWATWRYVFIFEITG